MTLSRVLAAASYQVRAFESGERFLEEQGCEAPGCLPLDLCMGKVVLVLRSYWPTQTMPPLSLHVACVLDSKQVYQLKRQARVST